METPSPRPVSLIPALRHVIHLLVSKEYGLLEDEDLIADLTASPRRHVSGLFEPTTPDDIQQQLAHLADHIAALHGPTWQELDRLVARHGSYGDPPRTATLIDVPDEAFADARIVAPVFNGTATHLVPIDLWTASDLGPPLAPGTWWIALDLWREEEGRSTLNVHVIVSSDPHKLAQLAYLSACPLVVIPPVQDLVHALVEGDYTRLLGDDPDVTPALIEEKLVSYRDMVLENDYDDDTRPSSPPRLVDLPVQAFRYATSVVQRDGSGAWRVAVNLWWSNEEFATDLALSTRVEQVKGGWVARLVTVDTRV